jgi:hypothetical protein
VQLGEFAAQLANGAASNAAAPKTFQQKRISADILSARKLFF